MSLRSTLTHLTGSLSFPLIRVARVTWLGAAVALGLTVSATGCGGCGDNNSLQPCPTGVGQPGMYCICDSLGCRVANLQGNGGSGGGVATGGSGTTTTSSSTSGCDPSQAACPCTANGFCPNGLDCVNGLCITGCNFSYECGAGNVCDNGACVPGCSSSQPCATGYVCTNGACTVNPASPQCSATNPCPSGQSCTNGICAAQCTTNNQCGTDEVCDGTTGTCIPDPSSKPVCSTSEPCPNGETCLADGFCHYPCNTTSDCQLIDNRFTCSGGFCKTQQEINPQCTLTMPCPDAGTCISNTCF